MWRLVKLCAAIMIAAGMPLAAQVVISNQVNYQGTSVPYATIRVCEVTSTGTPCNPTVQLYADYTLTIPVSQPVAADQFGNYTFFAANLPSPGFYDVQVTPVVGTTWSYVVGGNGSGSGCNPGASAKSILYSNGGAGCAGSAATLDAPGNFNTPGTLTGTSAAFSSTVAAATALPLPYTTVTTWGDSLTCLVPPATVCATYTLGTGTYPAQLQALLPNGVTVLNRGIAAQTSSDLLIRMGMCPNGGPSANGLPYNAGYCVATLTSPLGTAAGSTATFTVPNGNLGYRACAFSSVPIPVVINGIPGTCVDTSGTGLGTFTFTSSATSAGLANGTYNYNGNPPASELAGLNVIWIGTNDIARPGLVVNDVQAIVAGLPNGSDHVVLNPFNRNYRDGWTGNKEDNSALKIAGAQQAQYPGHFVEVRSALVYTANQNDQSMQTIDYLHDIPPYTARGIYTGSLVANITDTTACTFTVSGTPTPKEGYVAQIDTEFIYVITYPGVTTNDCIRGFGNSTAATHTAGATAVVIDGVHLNTTGYGLIAGWVFNWIQSDAGAKAAFLVPGQTLQNYKVATTSRQSDDPATRYAFQIGGFGDTSTYKAGSNAAHNQYQGTDWTAVGPFAGYSNQPGSRWTAIGKTAAFFNLNGSDHTAVGFAAGKNALGSQWTAIGSQAAQQATGGIFFAEGYQAAINHTSGDKFYASGSFALFNNLNCFACHASGYANSYNNQAGDGFTDVGYQGAYNNNGPGPYTGVGTFNGYNSSTGYDWTAVGSSSAYYNITGVGWTALGRLAGFSTDAGGSGTGSWVGSVNPVTIAVTSGTAPVLGSILTGIGIPSNDVVTAVSGAGPYSVTLTAPSTITSVGTYSWSVGGGGAGTSSFTVGNNPITITVTSGAAPKVDGILVGTNIPANDLITVVSGGGPYTVTLATAPTGSASGTYYWSGVHSSYWVGVGYAAGANNASGDWWTALGSKSLQFANTSFNVGVGYQAGTFITDGTTHNVTSANSVYLGASTKAKSDGDTNETVIGYNAIGNGTNTATIGDVTTTDVYLGQNGGATLHAVLANTNATLFSSVSTTDTVACPANTTANFATTYTIPANTIKAGTQLRLTLLFSMTATATVPTMAISLKIGGVSVFNAQPIAPLATTNPMSVGATFLIGGTAAASASSAVLTNIISPATSGNATFTPFSQSSTANLNTQQNLATNGSLTIQPILFCGANTAGNQLTLNQMLVEQVHQ